MLKFVIFASDKKVFEYNKNELVRLGVSQDSFIFADSARETRLDVLKKHPQTWLLYLDHDCLLNSRQLKQLWAVYADYKNKNSNTLVAGVYSDTEDMSVLQRAHNWIANTWLESSYESRGAHPMLLGGVFLIYWKQGSIEQDLGVGVWGAEDKYTAHLLKKAGFEFTLDRKLSVEHRTTSDFKHFVKRAYLHGVNDIKFFAEPRRASPLYWIRKIDFSNVSLVFLVLLHFSVQKAAKIFQIFRR